jgi:hypothetical protein
MQDEMGRLEVPSGLMDMYQQEAMAAKLIGWVNQGLTPDILKLNITSIAYYS